jgi:hypothetical protein
VDTGVGHQVGLELGKIHVQGTVEAQGGGERRHHLADKTVKVGVSGALNVEVATAHVVQGLVIKAEGAVGVLQKGVTGKHVVVRLNDSSRNLRGRGHSEGELGLAAVVDRKTLKEQGAETRSASTTSGVEDHEALKTCALVSELADAVKDKVNDLLSDGVVTTGVVVGSVLLAGDQLLRVVELTVGTSADLVTHTRLKIDEHATGHVLASTSLRKKGVEGVVTTTDGLVRRHLTIGLDAVLEAVQLPAGVTSLYTSLAEVNRKTFSHD